MLTPKIEGFTVYPKQVAVMCKVVHGEGTDTVCVACDTSTGQITLPAPLPILMKIAHENDVPYMLVMGKTMTVYVTKNGDSMSYRDFISNN